MQMARKQRIENGRGVSPVISVILVVAITVILAAVIGTVALGLTEKAGNDAPTASFSCSSDGQITHHAGDSISVVELENVYDGQINGKQMTAGDNVATDEIVWQDGSDSAVLFECDSYTDGLVFYWSLDDVDSGSAYDSIGGLHGTPKNDVTSGEGYVHSAGDFGGGDNDYVSIPADPSLNGITGEVTVAAWIYIDNKNDDAKVFSTQSTGSDNGFKLSVYKKNNKHRVEFEIRGGGSPASNRDVSGGTDLETGRWYHVVGRYDGESITTFVNGEEDREKDSITKSLEAASGKAAIGREVNQLFGDYLSWDGKIDDLRVYDRALSDAEITDLYDRTN
jgi:flagellin-like protein